MGFLFSTAYFPPVSYFCCLKEKQNIIIEGHENYIKQTYRNRCEILSANGPFNLIVPIQKHSNHTPIKEIKISYQENWPSLHWKSLVSSYNSSPFFMHYDYVLKPLIYSKQTFLWDFNHILLEKIISILKLNAVLSQSLEFQKGVPSDDYRNFSVIKKTSLSKLNTYPQVFDSKFGFTKDLSILDLIFNAGPLASEYF
jgi:hypothetical protein